MRSRLARSSFDRYGPPEVLRVAEVDRPVPKDDEVLVKIHATTVNRTDCGLRAADPSPISVRYRTAPAEAEGIPGSELSGIVEAAGAAVTEFEAEPKSSGSDQARTPSTCACRRGRRWRTSLRA